MSCFSDDPRDPHDLAMAAALDVLKLSDADRLTAMAAYFKALAPAQSDVSGRYSRKKAKPLSAETEDWMRRFQAAGVEMATDEACRKAIAARLF